MVKLVNITEELIESKRETKRVVKADVYEVTALRARLLAKNASMSRKDFIEKAIQFYDAYGAKTELLPKPSEELTRDIRFLMEEVSRINAQIKVIMEKMMAMEKAEKNIEQ